jgi:hypothetical protein
LAPVEVGQQTPTPISQPAEDGKVQSLLSIRDISALQVQSILASVDVQEFNLKALMKQLGAY